MGSSTADPRACRSGFALEKRRHAVSPSAVLTWIPQRGPVAPLPRMPPAASWLLEVFVKMKSQKDFWAGLMFVVVGVAFAWGATSYSFGNSARPGPAYFPFGLGVLLTVLGGIVLFKALTIETEDGDPIGPFAWKPLATILLSIVGAAVLMPRAGMLITLPLLIVCVSMAGDEFRIKEAAINAVLLTAGSWAVFIKGLGLTVPVLPPFLAG